MAKPFETMSITKTINQNLSLFLAGCSLMFLISSCIAPRKVVYMHNLADSVTGQLEKPRYLFENLIQKNDQLQIMVSGTNLQDLLIFNPGQNQQQLAVVMPGTIGYLVESDGKIEIPLLGRIKVEGLTRLALQDTLANKLKDFTRNPVVSVRFINYVASILGEVSRPGRVQLPNERMTILDAISQSGDVTIFAKLSNVIVVREIGGKREYGRINLLHSDMFKSPYFYLQNNDVVYVEPLPSKFIQRTGIPQYLAIVSIGLSLLLTVINLRRL
jgi:polysaccharide export outer membrane protein